MIEYLRAWYERHFSDPQVVILALFLIVGFAVVVLAGDILAPVLAGIIIAYLLDGAVVTLRRARLPRLAALLVVFSVFVAFLVMFVFALGPLLSRQVSQFFTELPNMISQGQQLLMQLPERYPNFISQEQVQELIGSLRSDLAQFGQRVVSMSLASVSSLISLLVYLILVPLMTFFLVKDKERILHWTQGFLPEDRALVDEVWLDVNQKIASYVRGKFVEILLVWAASFVTFTVLGLNYAMLLSFLVGVSVLIPYVGAVAVTVPIAFVAYAQWGWSTEFTYVLIAYFVIQFLDGNILVPLLFSEVVNLHPVAIIIAVLVFGGVWGMWGVFFAIPLATLVHAVINAWPSKRHRQLAVRAGDAPSAQPQRVSSTGADSSF